MEAMTEECPEPPLLWARAGLCPMRPPHGDHAAEAPGSAEGLVNCSLKTGVRKTSP